ncbi:MULTISPECIES: lipo-like protein [unclassified Shinella]|uniref:lipo-like protein n=1 Tax=unclassified Shinella TaxID=2643062 RepID=UPI00234F4A35|nr:MULTISPECIES: lipo-like protein [unclassified Shinella]MCO5153055.1 lipo-like protein [Shinella sp.]
MTAGLKPLTASRDTLLDRLGRRFADKLQGQTSGYEPYTPSDPETLARTLRPGDVLLVEGNQKVSAAIKYLTQSTWSHAALFVGDEVPLTLDQATLPAAQRPQLIEVNLGEGCVAVPLTKYRTYNTRICRPVGLTPEDRDTLVAFMISRLGLKYDLKNITDMLRYFMPTPPVPVRWRRRMIAFGSGDPTRAICSTLIAEAFEAIRYPILPDITRAPGHAAATSTYSREEILHIRHHSLYTPRDFDLSPYFEIVKPTLKYGFDYKRLEWAPGREGS